MMWLGITHLAGLITYGVFGPLLYGVMMAVDFFVGLWWLMEMEISDLQVVKNNPD